MTEIYGRAGSGKTQLAMQLCVAAAAQQGLASAFIDTEGKFSLERLEEIAVAVTARQEGNGTTLDPNSRHLFYGSRVLHQGVRESLSRMLLYSANNADELRSVLSAVEIEACARCDPDNEYNGQYRQPPLGIIVLDSIASPARRDFGKGDAASRAQFVMDCAKTLKRIAESLNLAVVVINQIGGATIQSESKGDEEKVTTPVDGATGALGNSWHYCATTRLKIETKGPTDAANGGQVREIVVMKSSLLRRGTTSYVRLSQDGFKDVPQGLLDDGAKEGNVLRCN